MKKIMFNDRYGLTQAVLEGKKTQTRRICRIQPPYENYEINFPHSLTNEGYYEKNTSGNVFSWRNKDNLYEFTDWMEAAYKVGEDVAIAQSYKDCGYSANVNDILCEHGKKIIKPIIQSKGWTNKMFVKPILMIHRIRITNIRIQRLQDISDEDCLAEGIEMIPNCGGLKPYAFYDKSIKVKSEKEGINYGWYRDFDTPREAYAALIDKVGKKGDWDSNPWVWAYTFELVK